MSFMEVDLKGLLEEYAHDLCATIVKAVAKKARELAPEKTGELRRKTRAYTSKGNMRVVSNAEHSMATEYGANAHMIFPVNKTMLKFPVQEGNSEGFAFASEVYHPGNRPQPFMAPAIKYVKRNIKTIAPQVFRQDAEKRKLIAKSKRVVTRNSKGSGA